ncbi:MAG: hypothetical protein L3J08_00120 [Flavobacteriaceae bacterium]|nr:hypothetical protein [Flavobacteriaceae bacterium]
MIKEQLEHCEEFTTVSIIVLKEKKSIYRGLNRNNENVSKYKIDGCVYQSSSTSVRCDYLLETKENLYFIELKGTDVQKGLKQVLFSIRNLKQYFENKNINARIITTRGAKPNRLNTYNEYRELLKLINPSSIVLSNTPFEENIN